MQMPALSTPFHKYDHVCCAAFRFWRGATREHPPQWGCDRGATKPEPKSVATLRAAVLFVLDVVAHSLQTPEGYARRSRLVWAKNPSPQTWTYLWNGVLRFRSGFRFGRTSRGDRNRRGGVENLTRP